MANEKVTTRNPWSFIPTLYFAEGTPYILINAVSVILYKKMGIDNATIAAWTSLLYLPWVIKMFWGPIVDTNSTKRNWIVFTQLAMTFCLASIAFSLHFSFFFYLSLAAFFIGAFVSATHDIAADGFYLLSLNKENQAGFVGIRSTFYRLSMIFGQGFLVWLAGFLLSRTSDPSDRGNIIISWTFAFSLAAVIYIILFVYHKFILPYPVIDAPAPKAKGAFADVFATYFKQKKIGVILAFIFLYRFGEAFLIKLASPFFLDKPEVGGLGLTLEQVGIVYGTIGIGCLLAGGIVGGLIIKKYGLKKCLWPMAIIIQLPMFVYVTMSFIKPVGFFAAPFVAFEQFSYGFGFTAYMVFLMYLANKSEYKTAHYAISTGLMAAGMMLPGFVAGFLQQLLGYQSFFIMTLLLGIPGIITLFFIPLEEDEKK
ncbi:MAG: MFS transporter [Ignavibacteriales bacterium]|nr:MFS transporter [Ignavibacteriales bacterium]